MPAARKPGEPNDLVASLHARALRQPVNNTITMARYYRSLDLLLGQISAYRAANNEEQLYVMMIRYTSMVIETIKLHKDFNPNAPQYLAVKQRAVDFMDECERLKLSLKLRDIQQPTAHTYNRPAEAIRIEDSGKLADIDWDAGSTSSASSGGGGGGGWMAAIGLGPAAAGAAAAAAASAPPMPPGVLDLGADLEWIPRSGEQQQQQGSVAAAAAGSAAAAGQAGSSGGVAGQQQQQQQPWPEPVGYSSHYTPSNAQLLQKHSLFAHRSGSSGSSSWQQQQQQQQLQQQGSGRARYPSFNSSPIDAVWATPAPNSNSSSGGAGGSGGGTAAPPDIGSLSLLEQQQRLLMQPSAGPSLGPQEIEVQNMMSCHGQPGGSCAAPPPPPSHQLVPLSHESVAEAAAAAAAGPKSLSKRIDLRDVHISVALMNDFLHYAASNTRRGIESCGILAGRLSASDSRFTVTTLIVPKQTGTSDTVEMLGEEEVWEVESSRELVPLGWIHTHPTQTCFLSSVDIHTQCGYQTMLEEAVAIVMAPTDSRKKCGIFRLTTPEGLSHVQRCTYRGFHSQCSSVYYELCGHVYLNPNAKHEVIDLRG